MANEKQNQEWDSLGRSIEEIIDKAINSQNYQELSRNITRTIDRATRTGSDALWRALDMSGATKPKETITVEPVDEHLNAGRPIIVGVDYKLDMGYNEGTTDHFIVITGRGFDSTIGEYYYTFMDNATSDINKGCSPDNRLFYDGDTYFGGNSMAGKLYNVTQVRPNNGKKYDTTSITRSIINFNFYNYEDLFTSFSPDFWLN